MSKNSLFICLIICLSSVLLNDIVAQEEETQISYKDSITVVDSLINKTIKFIEFTRISKYAIDLASGPQIRFAEQDLVKRTTALKKLKKKLKKNRITETEYNQQKAAIDTVLLKIDVYLEENSGRFIRMIEKSNRELDSLKKRKSFFENK